MEKANLKITGMSCGHCETAVTNTLEDIGVKVIKVSASDGIAEFEYDPSRIFLDGIKKEISDAGYGVCSNNCC